MDRNSVIGYVLIILLFAGYLFYTSNQQELERVAQQEQQDSINLARLKDSLRIAEEFKNKPAVTDTTTAVADSAQVKEEVVELPEELFTLQNDLLKLELSSKGGVVNLAQLKDYKRSDSTDLLLI